MGFLKIAPFAFLLILLAAPWSANAQGGGETTPLVIDEDGTIRIGGAALVVDGAVTITVGGTSIKIDKSGRATIGEDALVVEGDGRVTLGKGAVKVGTDKIVFGRPLSFGSVAEGGEFISLFGSSSGIGVQHSTTYFRSGSNFGWYKHGQHVKDPLEPGEGGDVLMKLEPANGLTVTGPVVAGGQINAKSGFKTPVVTGIATVVTNSDSKSVLKCTEQGSATCTKENNPWVTCGNPNVNAVEVGGHYCTVFNVAGKLDYCHTLICMSN